jgi:lysophospholipase L1-like esterase
MKFNKYGIFITAGLLVILAGSLSLNFLLYSRVKQYYAELNQVRLDPLGLSEYPTVSSDRTEPRLSRVVVFGDSRAASWTPPTVDRYEFVNRGISSQTSVQASQRFLPHVRALKPDVVVIQVGINDLKAIALFPERQDAIIANCQSNIKRIVEDAKELGAVVIVTTIFPVGTVPLERQPVWSDAINQGIQAVNTFIPTLADDRTVVFDAFSILADNQGKTKLQFEVDELHLNQQGYEALNQELVKQLQTVHQRTIKSRSNQP